MVHKIGFILAFIAFAVVGIYRSTQSTSQEQLAVNSSNTSINERDLSGDVLGRYQYQPHIYLSGNEGYSAGGVIPLTTKEEPYVNVSSYGVSGTAKVEIYKANLDALLTYLTHDKEGKQLHLKTDISQFDPVTTQSLSIVSNSDNEMKILLPITDNETGIWFVRLTLDKTVTENFVIRSGFGVAVKTGDNQLIFWGTDYQTRRSIPAGTLAVYSLLDTQKELTDVGFGPDGIALTSLTTEGDVALATRGDDLALVPLNLQYLNSGRSFGSFHPKEKKTMYFVFSDRPLYKPDDTVYFKTILRDDDDVRYSIPSGTARVLLYKDWDERQTIFDKNFDITQDGTVYGQIKLPEGSMTGYYTLKVSVPKPETSYSNYTWEENTTTFQVENFRKPEFGIDIEAPNTEIISGDRLAFTITGSYFSGQPLTGNVTYKITTNDFWDYDYYYSDLPNESGEDFRWGYWGSKSVKTDSLTFDSHGRATAEYVYRNLPDSKKNQVISIEATYDNGSGNPSFARKNILVYAGEYGIYRKDSWKSIKVGNKLELPVILVSHRNTPVSNINLTATVTRESWISYQETGQKYLSYKKETENLGKISARTNASGEAVLTTVPKKTGSYIFTVTGKDSLGNTITKTFYKWVSQDDEVNYWGEGNNDLQVQTDKEEYSLGQTAKLTISSVIPDRDVLLSLERGRVNRYQIVHLVGKKIEVPVDIQSTDMPNIFASVTSFSDDWVDTESTNIVVPAVTKQMHVSITPDRETYGPGDTITLNIETTDNTGSAVSADTAIWAVDKAIFELADQPPLAIFKKFWSERYNNTVFSHSLAGITVNNAEHGGCFVAGTRILMAGGTELNIQDIKPGDKILTKSAISSDKLSAATVSGVSIAEETGYIILNKSLRVTPDHYLFVNGEWMMAGSVKIGDLLLGRSNQTLPVTSIEWLTARAKVYNLEIETYHTFFADGVWVHNQKGDGGGRSLFKDTAYWNPTVRTGVDGRAQIRFKLPDNLTTWVIAAVGSTLDTKVGNWVREVTVTKDIIVRPILPNIFRSGDTMTLKALVQNFTSVDRVFTVSLQSDAFEIPNAKQTRISIAAKSNVEVIWNISPAPQKENAKLTYTAISQDDASYKDVITVQLPMRQFGFHDREAQVGNGPSQFKISLSPDADPKKSDVALSLSPSLSGTLVPSMKYLVDYPYGCIEQTTSRFVPAIIAKLNPNLYETILAGKNIDDILKTGVERITKLQRPDGGWTWWFSGPSDLFVSTYVIEYLQMAKNTGVPIPEEVLSKAKSFISQVRKPENYGVADARDAQVIQAYALGLFPDNTQGSALHYHEGTGALSVDILAMEIMANVRLGVNNPDQNGLSKLLSLAKTQNGVTYWEAGSKLYFGSRDATSALAIRAILASGGPRETAIQAVRYLMGNRRYDYWSNTFATSQVIRAVTELSTSGSEDNPNYTYDVQLDGKSIRTGKVTDVNEKIADVKISPSAVKPEGSNLQIILTGEGQLYSVFVADQFRTDRKASATSHGINITREYLNKKGSQYSIGVGDEVEIRLTLDGLSDENYYGVVEDELPAGLVPIIETLKNEQFSQNPSNYYNYWGATEVEYTQNGAILSAYRFGGGRREYTYQARAVTAGDYIVPPATASLMYSPEIYGRTAVSMLKISDTSTYDPNAPVFDDIPPENVQVASGRMRPGEIAALIFILLSVGVGIFMIKPVRERFVHLVSKFHKRKKDEGPPPSPPPIQNSPPPVSS